MIPFLITLWGFVRAFKRSLEDREFRAMFILFLVLLVSGTSFYATVEGWSILDAFYFSVITLSTVGYGDLHPTTGLSKIFTVFYLLTGIGVFVALITKLATGSLQKGKKKGRE